jgi:hypothetical protein
LTHQVNPAFDTQGNPTEVGAEIMAKIARITITVLSCLSLSVLGTAGAASAHTGHAARTVVSSVGTGTRMHSNGDGWCC